MNFTYMEPGAAGTHRLQNRLSETLVFLHGTFIKKALIFKLRCNLIIIKVMKANDKAGYGSRMAATVM